MPDSGHEVRVVPLTPELWPAFEDLLSQAGPCSRCWCLYWRIGPEYRKHKPETNRSAFRALVLGGPPPGLIALSGHVSLGWCQLTPRNRLPWLDRVRKLRRVDNEPVWSVSCFYVRKGHRKKGVSRRLLEAAIETARRNRVRILEAYPLDARLTGTSSLPAMFPLSCELVLKSSPGMCQLSQSCALSCESNPANPADRVQLLNE